MTHQYNDREDGLLHCKICGGGEGGLTKDCPGSLMSAQTQDLVYAQIINYESGAWAPGWLQRRMALLGKKYVVKDEHTLGYLVDELGLTYMGVLHGSVLKGGHDWKNGAVYIGGNTKLRPATLADFEEYRCSVPRDFNP